MKKTKRITVKSIIALILVVALLFNVVTPVYAREGNTGSGNTWSAMLLGAYNGATASSTIGWTQWAMNLFVQVAVDYADLVYYVNHYSDYGKSVISLNIGGTHISISRGQMVRMVASAAASTVAGAATGSGLSVGTVVNNLTNSFVRTAISSIVYQLLVKKFGLDPALASLASSVVTSFVSDHWNFITTLIPQAGTLLDELIDPEDKQLEITRKALDKLKKGVVKEIMGEKDSPKEEDSEFTREEVNSLINLSNNTIQRINKRLNQLKKEWWHISTNRVEAEKTSLEQELGEQVAFRDNLVKLAKEIENRDIPYGVPLKSVEGSIMAGMIRESIDDPLAVGIERGLRKFSINVATKIDPSLPEKIEQSKVAPVTLNTPLNTGENNASVSLNVGDSVDVMFNGAPTTGKVTKANDDGSNIITNTTDNRELVYNKTADGYTLQPLEIRAGDLLSLARKGDSAVVNYTVKSADGSGKYTLTMGTDTQLFGLVQDADGGYSLQSINNTSAAETVSYKVNIVPQVVSTTTNANTSNFNDTQSVQPQTEAEITQRSLIQNYQPLTTQP